jgi:hypothetical protein
MTKSTSRKITLIERIEIAYHYSNTASVSAELRDGGYLITHSGPYTNRKMFPKVDPDWFMITAERKLKPNVSES